MWDHSWSRTTNFLVHLLPSITVLHTNVCGLLCTNGVGRDACFLWLFLQQMDDDIIRADRKEDNFDDFTIDREVVSFDKKNGQDSGWRKISHCVLVQRWLGSFCRHSCPSLLADSL